MEPTTLVLIIACAFIASVAFGLYLRGNGFEKLLETERIKSERLNLAFRETLLRIKSAARHRSALLENRISSELNEGIHEKLVQDKSVPKAYPRRFEQDKGHKKSIYFEFDFFDDILEVERFFLQATYYQDILAFYADGDYDQDFDLGTIYEDSDSTEAQAIMRALNEENVEEVAEEIAEEVVESEMTEETFESVVEEEPEAEVETDYSEIPGCDNDGNIGEGGLVTHEPEEEAEYEASEPVSCSSSDDDCGSDDGDSDDD